MPVLALQLAIHTPTPSIATVRATMTLPRRPIFIWDRHLTSITLADLVLEIHPDYNSGKGYILHISIVFIALFFYSFFLFYCRAASLGLVGSVNSQHRLEPWKGGVRLSCPFISFLVVSFFPNFLVTVHLMEM